MPTVALSVSFVFLRSSRGWNLRRRLPRLPNSARRAVGAIVVSPWRSGRRRAWGVVMTDRARGLGDADLLVSLGRIRTVKTSEISLLPEHDVLGRRPCSLLLLLVVAAAATPPPAGGAAPGVRWRRRQPPPASGSILLVVVIMPRVLSSLPLASAALLAAAHHMVVITTLLFSPFFVAFFLDFDLTTLL